MQSKPLDVAVIGAGLAGLRCAWSLAGRGLSVALVDQRSRPGSPTSTTGIFVRKTLEDFEIPSRCLGPWIRHVTLRGPYRARVDLCAERGEFRVARMRELFDYLLQRCVEAGVAWYPRVRFDGEDSLRRHGISVRFIVGADGARSRVARELGLDENRKCILGLEDVLVSVRTAGPPACHCWFDPVLAPGYIAWVVTDGEYLHVGVAGYPHTFDPSEALARFKQSVHSEFEVIGSRAVERRAALIPVGGVLQRIANERGLLVGDAAGAPSPLTAGGIDACFRLSDIAAATIANHMAHGGSRLVAGYRGDAFRPRYYSRMFLRLAIERVRSRFAAELCVAALSRPPLRWLAQRIFFHRGSFPELRLQKLTSEGLRSAEL